MKSATVYVPELSDEAIDSLAQIFVDALCAGEFAELLDQDPHEEQQQDATT